MSNEEITRKLEELQDYLSTSNIFTDIIRCIGWVFIKRLAWIVDKPETLTDEILLVKGFYNNPETVAFMDSIKPFLYILLAFSLLYTGYLLIFQKKFNREGIAFNLFLTLMVILTLNAGMDKTDDSSLSGLVIHRKVVDLTEVTKIICLRLN
ncbi:hypothetical protein ACFFIS_05905 [Virgibacillus soli]|uniref:DUF8208 domain-containing protein n=1 Tax=Paracerasibacillus soli TaxID=480284 RepID=A0ABU5CWC9_9BACI|nr:hypothetical protein [Virgibacillus soli]MDY0409720.1 hypothetical protein [Virgibacillus soli]